jgi:hypothetical protein
MNAHHDKLPTLTQSKHMFNLPQCPPKNSSAAPYLAPGKLKPNPGTAGGVATATGSGLTTC